MTFEDQVAKNKGWWRVLVAGAVQKTLTSKPSGATTSRKGEVVAALISKAFLASRYSPPDFI
jgi:hypothetical protein